MSDAPNRVVVKIGTSSLTAADGVVDPAAVASVCSEVAAGRKRQVQVVLVTSGAISAGLGPIGLARRRPRDILTLQACSAVGQTRLMAIYEAELARHGLIAGQVLLTPSDFWNRKQYLHAGATLGRLLELGVVPVVNENDAIADDEIRFGDNDRLAALVAQLLRADLLILLTDTEGLLDNDPRVDPDASLVEEVLAFDAAMLASAGGPGSERGSGGMASKVAAAHMASWSGIPTIIASAERQDVVVDSLDQVPGVGTRVHAAPRRLGARKAWIAFASAPAGRLFIDSGAVAALLHGGRSLLTAGITGFEGEFGPGEAVEIVGPGGTVVAKGLTRLSTAEWRGSETRSTANRGARQVPVAGQPRTAVHRDDLVLLVDPVTAR